MEEEIKRAIDFVLSNHAKYADIRLERGYATVIDLRDDVFREMSYGIDQGMGVRVLYKDSWGFSSSNDIARSAIRTSFEDALKIGRALSLSESESTKNVASVTVADAASRNDHFKLKPKINPEDVSIEEKKRMVKDAYDAATEYSDLIKSISVVYLDGYEEQIYANSDGSYIVTETPAVFMRAGVVAKKASSSV